MPGKIFSYLLMISGTTLIIYGLIELSLYSILSIIALMCWNCICMHSRDYSIIQSPNSVMIKLYEEKTTGHIPKSEN